MKMDQVMRAVLVFTTVLIYPVFVWSQANFVIPGNFIIQTPCKAYISFRNETGESSVEVNRTYTAYGENKSTQASHVHLDVGGQRKWVSLDCGEYVGEKPAFVNETTGGGTTEPGAECLPFFDSVDNLVNVGVGGSVDITPEAPEIEPFGVAVNNMCGSAGKITSKTEFKQLLMGNPDVLLDLIEYTKGKVFADRPAHQDIDTYLEDLTEAWYAIHAFDHIFCGEPLSANSIGGLHFYGRYRQLQAEGDACRMANFDENEVVPGSVYTMGVRMKRADGGWAQFDTKGYGLTLSAADILKVATRAFSENPTSSSSSAGCILDLDDADTNYKMVFVRRAQGIRTFYPDATPDFARNPACANTVSLNESTEDGDRTSLCDSADDTGKVLRTGRFIISVTSFDDRGFDLHVEKCD